MSLGGLVLLPFGNLSSQLLHNSGDISLAHGLIDLDLGKVLNHTKAEVELALGSRSRRGIATLLALLSLLAASTNKVIFLVFLDNLHTLDA